MATLPETKSQTVLKLFSGKALFELTAERNQKVVDRIMVVGNTDHIEWSKSYLKILHFLKVLLLKQLPKIRLLQLCSLLLAVNADDILVITPSDHLIQNQKDYEHAINEAVELAKK